MSANLRACYAEENKPIGQMTNWKNSNICSRVVWWHFRAPISNRLLFTLRAKSNGNSAFPLVKSTMPLRHFPLSPAIICDERMRRAFKGKFWRPFTFLTFVPQPGPGPTPDSGKKGVLAASSLSLALCSTKDVLTGCGLRYQHHPAFPSHVLKAPCHRVLEWQSWKG